MASLPVRCAKCGGPIRGRRALSSYCTSCDVRCLDLEVPRARYEPEPRRDPPTRRRGKLTADKRGDLRDLEWWL